MRSLSFHCTCVEEVNPLPFTTKLMPVNPATAEVGNMLLRTTGALMLKVADPEVPPPGVGFTTDTVALPAAARSPTGMVACNWVGLVEVIVRLELFHITCEVEMNPLPVTVSVKAVAPAVAETGEMLPITGVGFTLAIVNVWLAEVPPPGVGLNTVTRTVPAEAMSDAAIDAVNCVALTYDVGRLEPFHCTALFVVKALPFTVREKEADPGSAEAGEMVTNVGAGLLMLTVAEPRFRRLAPGS